MSLCTFFDAISSNLDEVFSINLFADVLVFNIYHKDWLIYSGGTNRPFELCYDFPISNELTQIVNFPAQIPSCDSHSPALLDFFIFSGTGIYSTMGFPPMRNSGHVFYLSFHWLSIKLKSKKEMHLIVQLVTIPVLVKMVFGIT